jgi:hypothetical protein
MSKKRKLEDWRTDTVLKKRACMIAHRSFKWSRGWWVREYHSPIAMEQHLRGTAGREYSYGDTGPFRTEEEAREFALGWWPA